MHVEYNRATLTFFYRELKRHEIYKMKLFSYLFYCLPNFQRPLFPQPAFNLTATVGSNWWLWCAAKSYASEVCQWINYPRTRKRYITWIIWYRGNFTRYTDLESLVWWWTVLSGKSRRYRKIFCLSHSISRNTINISRVIKSEYISTSSFLD